MDSRTADTSTIEQRTSTVAQARRPAAFLTGLFLLCACVLILQIVETRLLSVISFYHLAFFAISMAMFGMTAGSLIVYFNPTYFAPQRLLTHLVWIASAFAITVPISTVVLISTVLLHPSSGTILSAVLWLKLIAALVPPYVFAGMGISLALTRSPWPIGLVYGSDLAGAAFGCLAALVLMSTMDGVSAMLAVGAIGACAAAAFSYQPGETWQHVTLPGWARALRRPFMLAGILSILALGNAAIQPHGLMLSNAKGKFEGADKLLDTQWNSYSRVVVEKTMRAWPAMWGGSPTMPLNEIDQNYLNIDGDAGTAMYRFNGDLGELDFLQFDITNLAYRIRNHGRSAVIGVGGGRDMLSAYAAGFRDVTGVELNPIFISYLTGRYRDFNRLADLPGVHFVVDDARSWFGSTGRGQKFDLVQMSMIDTWAATGVGAFSLSENGLYTVQGWRHFLGSLAPNGVFTVSRWYSPTNIAETGRLLSLAKATLLAMGITNPRNHLFLASTNNLTTLIVARAPFTPQELATLHGAVKQLQFAVLVAPDTAPASPALRDIMDAPDADALAALSNEYHLDVSAPTDDRPFFFNQLRMTDLVAMSRALSADAGVVRGNLEATIVLAIIVVLSSLLVILTIILPALPSVRRVAPQLVAAGTSYFLLIGLGFMFVEIGLIQRLSIFLGHPVYGVAVGLFAIVLSTGIGSLISDRVPINARQRALIWCGLLVAYLASLPFWLPFVVEWFEIYSILVRAFAAVAVIAPLGLLMGFGFPTGMRLVNAVDSRPTPWFWAVNGAAGVLGASIAVAVNVAFSIDVSLWLGAVCYLLVGGGVLALLGKSPDVRRPTMEPALATVSARRDR